MQKLKITHPDSANRIENGIVVGWVVLVIIVILVAAALARFIVGGISAQAFASPEFTNGPAATTSNADPFTFSDPWVRATPPGAMTAAAYLSIGNAGAEDRLLHALSDGARRVEIHTSSEQDGMMRMSQLESLTVPAEGVVQMVSGAHHLMFIDIPQALIPGDSVNVTLLFENAGAREVSFTVKDAR